MAEFERALDETRASVTPEMEQEYERIQDSLKQDARGAPARHRLHRAGHAHSAGAEGLNRQRRPGREPGHQRGGEQEGQGEAVAVEPDAERRRRRHRRCR